MPISLSQRQGHERLAVKVRVFRAARERLLEIWNYTERTWGEEQADRYVRELMEAIHGLHGARHRWRSVTVEALADVFVSRYRHHYLFFRELSSGDIGLISVLHENMDLPARLKEECEKEDQV